MSTVLGVAPTDLEPSTDVDGLQVAHLAKNLRAGKEVAQVLHDLHIDIPEGAVAWVGGENGAGKTTLLRVLGGILIADSGSVRFRGLDPNSQRSEYQRAVGFLSAGDRALFARLNVRRHLSFAARVAFIPRGQRKQLIERAVAAFDIEQFLDRRVERLSLGQRQRVRLAMTFLHEPALALLDEPASSLDEEGLGLLRSAIAAVVARGGVVVWCSPPIERTAIRSDLEMVLRDGGLRDT